MAVKTIITINRQFGSLGKEIGRQLATELGVQYYDKELIALAAKESGFAQSVFENVDEKPTNSLLYSLVMSSYATHGWFHQQSDVLSSDKLFSIQAAVIRKVSAESCVIVGRCADFLLRDEPGLLTVFTHAPIEVRKQNLRTEFPEATDKELESIIRRQDKQRANYYNYYTSRDWINPSNYHLSLNTAVTGVKGAIKLILDLKEIRENRNEA